MVSRRRQLPAGTSGETLPVSLKGPMSLENAHQALSALSPTLMEHGSWTSRSEQAAIDVLEQRIRGRWQPHVVRDKLCRPAPRAAVDVGKL